MKKTVFALALCAALLLAGCQKGDAPKEYVYGAQPSSQAASSSASQAPAGPHDGVSLPQYDGDVIDITEKLFIAQTNDIYLNGQEYVGKTIRYEGIYKNSADWDEGPENPFHFVIRYGPGCCGYDGEAGFEVRWADANWPEVDAWVEVVGTIEIQAYESGYKALYVNVQSLTVKEVRGAEYVAT